MNRTLAWTVACTAALVACGGSTGQKEPPPVPENLQATPGDGVVGLRWDAVAGAEGYTVYWSRAPGVTHASGTAIHTQATTLNHASLDNGVTYHYVVTATNAAGESPESAEASATPLPAYEPLTVAKAGTGGGSVVSAPPGIDCGSVCAASPARGSSVTLNATPDDTSTFDGWSGDCTGGGECALTMDDVRSVTATFTRITHLLTVVRAGTGAGSVTSAPAGIDCGATCEATFDAATEVTLTAAPDATSTFAGWSGACTGTGDCTVSVDAAETVIATFTRITRTLSITRTGTGGGSVTAAPAGIDCGATCQTAYDLGTVVELAAVPDGTSTFAGWGGACTGTGSCTVTMDQPRSVTATFTRFTYVLTTAVSPGGTLTSAPAGIDCLPTCSAGYDAGTAVTLTVHPVNGAIFVGWCLGCSGTSPTCTITMDAAHSVSACFAYPLAVSRAGTGGGTVTSSPGGINCGSTCDALPTPGTAFTLTATPDSTSVFAGWSGDCTGTGTCTVQMTAARSVIATFTKKTYALSVTRTDGGTVTSTPSGIDCGTTCQATLVVGTAVTLTASPASGATFAGWAGACTGTGGCTVTMDAARSVNARFTYPLTATRSGNGAGTVTSTPVGISCGSTCGASFDAGVSVTLTASPDATSVFAGWSGDCSGSSTCTVPMSAARSVDATFARMSYALSVTRSGGGTVTSTPAGIDCGQACMAMFPGGTSVTLTAAPDAGATFAGWTGACSGTGTCTLTMDSTSSVGANFTYPLTVTRSGGGAGTVSSVPVGISCGSICSAGFGGGMVVTLVAAQDDTSVFEGWTGPCSGAGTCQVTMDQVRSVDAHFASRPAILSTSVTAAASGAVSLEVRDGDPGQSLTLSKYGDGTCRSQPSPPSFSVTAASIGSGTGDPVTFPGALQVPASAATFCVYLSISDGTYSSTQEVSVTVP